MIRHMSLCVEGILTNWPASKLKNLFTDESGKKLTAQEAKQYLVECLKEGKLLLPLKEPCEGFSYQTGCPGHKS